MPEKTIIAFYCICFCFGLNQLLFRNKFIVSFPIVGTNYPFRKFFNFFPELVPRFSSSCANFAIDKPMPISINSNPYPTVVFFEPIYVCISSSSITSISSGFLNSSIFSPKDFIQLNTATWLTFKYLPIDLKPSPSKYKIKAFLLTSLGFPICSTVNRCLQSLHRYLTD